MDPHKEQEFKQKAKDAGLETFDIPGVEVFAAGTWNKDAYSVQDLDDMVHAYSELGTAWKPFLKLGHGQRQALLHSDELPAAGWVSRLYREGDKLMADFTGVPKKIFQLMKARAYRTRSAEIVWNLKSASGKVYRRALKAVALLGGETPAVQTLNDVLALYADCGTAAAAYGQAEEARAYKLDPEEGKDMDMEALKSRNEALEKENRELREGKNKEYAAQIKTLTEENDTLKTDNAALKARAETAEAKTAEFSAKAMDKEVETEVSKLISEKKILPAQKETAYALLRAAAGAEEKNYSLGKDKVSLKDLVTKLFAQAPKVDVPSENPDSEVGEKRDTGDLAKAAKEYAAKHNVSIKEATLTLVREQEQKAKA